MDAVSVLLGFAAAVAVVFLIEDWAIDRRRLYGGNLFDRRKNAAQRKAYEEFQQRLNAIFPLDK